MKKLITILTALLTLGSSSIAFAGDKILEFEWNHDDPEGQSVSEFRIYASMASGVHDKANDLLLAVPFTAPAQPVYTGEGTLASPDGQQIMWYFVATAVDDQGNESGFSNEASGLVAFAPPDDPHTLKAVIKVTAAPSP